MLHTFAKNPCHPYNHSCNYSYNYSHSCNYSHSYNYSYRLPDTSRIPTLDHRYKYPFRCSSGLASDT